MDESKYIIQLKGKIKDLEDEIDELANHSILSKFSEAEGRMIRIITREMERLEKNCEKLPLEKDEVKIFDTYVKDYVALRGKIKDLIEDNDDIDDEELAELISIVQGGKSD